MIEAGGRDLEKRVLHELRPLLHGYQAERRPIHQHTRHRVRLGQRNQLRVIVPERNAADLAQNVEHCVAVRVDDVVADALGHVGEEVCGARVLDRVHVPVDESDSREDRRMW
jgi:hypothetical protein